MTCRDERGVMLMHAIVLMSLVSFAVAAVAGAIAARAAVVRATAASLQATYAAESGIAAAVAGLRNGHRSVERGQVGPCPWRVELLGDPSSGAVTLDATGECAGRQHRVIYRAAGPGWVLNRTG